MNPEHELRLNQCGQLAGVLLTPLLPPFPADWPLFGCKTHRGQERYCQRLPQALSAFPGPLMWFLNPPWTLPGCKSIEQVPALLQERCPSRMASPCVPAPARSSLRAVSSRSCRRDPSRGVHSTALPPSSMALLEPDVYVCWRAVSWPGTWISLEQSNKAFPRILRAAQPGLCHSCPPGIPLPLVAAESVEERD